MDNISQPFPYVQNNIGGCLRKNTISLSKDHIHFISYVKNVNALYQDSVEGLVTTFCFVDDHNTKLSPKNTQ